MCFASKAIKAALKSEKEKLTLLGSLFALKAVEEYNRISITEDLKAERTSYKLLSGEEKDKSNQLSQKRKT